MIMNEIKIFTNEEFGEVKVINIYNNAWFVAKDIAEILGYGNGNKNSKSLANAIVDHVEEEDRKMLTYEECKGLFRGYQNGDPTFKINSNGLRVINESGLYSLILSSKLPTAKKFKRWVTSEVLPTIRKTGGYVNNDDMFINTYLPFADETTKLLFKNTLNVINNQNKLISHQKNEIKRKSDVIQGFADDIPNPTKRKILNEVVRCGGGNYKERWTCLYREFKAVHGIDVSVRYKNYVEKGTRPKMNSKLDYVDKKLHMLQELYGIAVKLYESDIEKIKERYDILSERDFDYGKKKIKC